MQLAKLADNYHDFYAPTFSVLVSGEDVVRNLLIPVSQVEVDLMLGASSRFSFTVTDCYRPDSDSFKSGDGQSLPFFFGSEVEISLGYRDSGSMSTVLQGVITEITTDFPESGSPELTISGYDHGFPLTIGKNSVAWKKRRDTDVAHSIASFHNLGSEIYPGDQPNEVREQTEQSQESDWAFLNKLAERNHFELFVDEQRNLHFHPRNTEKDVVVELAYGKGLLSFKPEANLAGQISGVEVYGWDSGKKERIVGVATAGDESNQNGKSGGDILNRFIRSPDKRPILRVRQPVFTQAEANQRAKAALRERAKKFLTGEGETIGIPTIRPDRKIKLNRLGGEFSKSYYIKQATHKIDTNGYRTRFKVEEMKI